MRRRLAGEVEAEAEMGGAKASAVHSEEQLARWSTELKVLRQENGAGSGERRRLQGERVEPEISCQRGTKIIFLNCRQIMSNAARNFGGRLGRVSVAPLQVAGGGMMSPGCVCVFAWLVWSGCALLRCAVPLWWARHFFRRRCR